MTAICYIHGAGATPHSFAWLAPHLPPHRASFFSYDVDTALVDTASALRRHIADLDGPLTLLGHSLGGVLAAGAAHLPQVARVVTLCAPFGGIKGVEMTALFNSAPLFRDAARYGEVLCAARHAPCVKPHLAIIGTHGLPFFSEPNDGVVTLASQTAKFGPLYQAVPLNHYEVLLAPQTAAMISGFLFGGDGSAG